MRARCSYVLVGWIPYLKLCKERSGNEILFDTKSSSNLGSNVLESILGVEFDCHPTMQVALEGMNLLHDASSSLLQEEASYRSEFVLYN